MCIRFIDDTKLGWISSAQENRNKIQNEPDNLEKWFERKNRMKFNRDKCKVLRVRKRNQSTCVKELGIIVDYKLNMSQHCDIVAERANAI